jgi:hypothetical protein
MLIDKLPIFLVNTLLLSRFHKHSFTLFPSLSGQVGISSIPSKNADRNTLLLICSHKHSFTLYPSLSPYSPTDGTTDGGTNTLAARGLEELRVNLLLKENSYVSYIILHQSYILELKF